MADARQDLGQTHWTLGGPFGWGWVLGAAGGPRPQRVATPTIVARTAPMPCVTPPTSPLPNATAPAPSPPIALRYSSTTFSSVLHSLLKRGGGCNQMEIKGGEICGDCPPSDVTLPCAGASGGAKVTSVPCDVADPAAVDRMMAHATEQFGRVDVVICNAGSNAYTYAPIAETEPTALEEILLTNGVGTLLCCRAAIRTMQAQPQGGHVFVMEGVRPCEALIAWNAFVAVGHRFGVWLWSVALECGFGVWLWSVALECGFGVWLWSVALECGFGVWLWSVALE